MDFDPADLSAHLSPFTTPTVISTKSSDVMIARNCQLLKPSFIITTIDDVRKPQYDADHFWILIGVL